MISRLLNIQIVSWLCAAVLIMLLTLTHPFLYLIMWLIGTPLRKKMNPILLSYAELVLDILEFFIKRRHEQN